MGRMGNMVQRAKGFLFWFLLLGKRAGARPKPTPGGKKRGAEEEENDELSDGDEGQSPTKKVMFI
jgi:hypothetical protein